MVTDQKFSKIWTFCNLLVIFFFIKIVGSFFISPSFDLASMSTISSHIIIAESSITLTKYLPFWQLHVAGFQI